LRGADVAYVAHIRWASCDDDDNLAGSPELVIEVLSASNTKAEMREKATLCLTTGAEEFWIVHPKRKNVTVMKRFGEGRTYELGDRIPLSMFNTELAVSQTFA
jgi:Uma2 family endonuclease